MTVYLAILVGAYFLGAIPFGVLIARAKGIDLTKVGSGNIGATNVNRALGKNWGLAVFALDMLKGLIPGLVARQLVTEPLGELDPQALWFIAGFVAVLGHAKSPFLGFKGSKGVSSALGAGLAAAPLAALAGFALFILILATTRYMAIASMVGVPSAGLFALVIPGNSIQVVPLLAILGLMVIWLHRKNIDRLREGTEPKFSFVKKPIAEASP